VYSVNNNVNDIFITLIFGVIGYFFGLFGYSMASLVLGVVLAPLLEEHLRRALLISDGSYLVFLERPISAVFVILSVLVMLLSFKGEITSFLFRRPRRGVAE